MAATDRALQLEATLCWGDQVLTTKHFAGSHTVTIGATDRADFFVDVPGLDGGLFPIVRCVDGQHLLTVGSAMRGEVRSDAGSVDLAQLPGEPDAELAGCRRAPLPPETTTTIALGGLSLQLRLVPAPPPLASWLSGEPNYGLLNVALVSLFVHAGLFTAAWLYPLDGHTLTENLLSNPGRARLAILVPPTPKQAPLPAEHGRSEAAEPAAARHHKPEGSAGAPTAPERNRRLAFAGPQPSSEAIVAGKVASLFGTTPTGLNKVFGTAAGSDLIDALGKVTGTTVGDARGLGGLGPRGGGPGGGGHGLTTYGVGAIATVGRGTGQDRYGTGDGILTTRVDRAPPIEQRPVVIGDALARDIIKRVIREHLNEVRYCYERELQRAPGLWGKVQVRFVIGASGAVHEVTVVENTVAADAVASCISGRVHSWRFPRPRGGGVVIVSYPFLLKQGG